MRYNNCRPDSIVSRYNVYICRSCTIIINHLSYKLYYANVLQVALSKVYRLKITVHFNS